jgi:diguanylate cyclase (GGDEF)-like protein
MLGAANIGLSFLDGPTLAFVMVCIVALLGLFLILAWLQQRDVGALAWWGSAYLLGATALAMWGAPQPWFPLPRVLPFAMIFVACGMIWNGVRLFRGRPLRPIAGCAGAVVWLSLCQLPIFPEGSFARIALGVIVVATYTFFIALELSRERRKSLRSRTAAIVVPGLHAAIFLMPLAMRAFMPDDIAVSWITVFALETSLYAVGTAVIVLLMVKDHHVDVYRHAASVDFLTGLLNRRAFLENALKLCAQQAGGGSPVTMLMFDLDHFKAVNDRFGHAVGDEVLRVFAQVVRKSTRASDIVGRLGGEEFGAIVAEPTEFALMIGERIRAGFEAAGAEVAGHAVGATVSIGAATAHELVTNIDALIARADAALYRAKGDGRNRLHTADEEPEHDRARLIAAARGGKPSAFARLLRRDTAA